jgi:hypothetical protein
MSKSFIKHIVPVALELSLDLEDMISN